MQILKVGNLKKVLEENTGKILNDFKGIECKVIGKNFVICKSEGEKKDNLKTVLEDINRYFIKEKENNNYQSLLSKNVVINIYDDYYYAKDIKEENGNLVFVRFISSI